jgi:hypothetical protein
MARTYEYAVLTAVPNPRRGERVNVGVIVFRPDGLDVRFNDAERKLRALTGDNWKDRIAGAEARLKNLFEPNLGVEKLIEKIRILDPLFQASALGELHPQKEEEYGTLVEQIVSSLVAVVPKREKPETTTRRINTEIVDAFSNTDVIAKRDETIEDHKMVRNFAIDSEEGLVADFALKNGKLIVAATLDLRLQSAELKDAALKSVTLDKARKNLGTVKTVGVYAVDNDMRKDFRQHIAMLGGYADEMYDWTDLDGKRGFKKSIFDALKIAGGELL